MFYEADQVFYEADDVFYEADEVFYEADEISVVSESSLHGINFRNKFLNLVIFRINSETFVGPKVQHDLIYQGQQHINKLSHNGTSLSESPVVLNFYIVSSLALPDDRVHLEARTARSPPRVVFKMLWFTLWMFLHTRSP